MRFGAILALTAAFAAGTAASAATSITSVAADFSSPVGGGGTVRYTDTDGQPGNEQIRWGQGTTNSSKSGLAFSAAPTQTITQGVQFQLGLLTYFNVPIDAGTEVTSLDLGITAGLNANGTPLAAGPFLFTIAVDETPNDGPISRCPYTSNVPCSDRISISTGGASQTFELDGQTLTLFIDGFLDRNLNTQSNFIAQENESTTATLVGHFDLASNVPEPASWAMFIGGFGLLGGALRRDRRSLSLTVRSVTL